ncbi:NUDIX domain-containing protein [Nocardioides montaniterrae]
MYTSKYPIINVTVDVALLCPCPEGLSVLLIQRKHDPYAGAWALPGGFVDADEDAETAARRELREETGLELSVPLTQLHTYTAPDRDPRGRTISIVHLASVPETVAATAGDDAADVRWFPVSDLPELAFDHAEVLADALAAHARG